MSTRDKVKDLVQLVSSGQLMEAFETYYAENVEMQENRKEPMVGKGANRERERQFVESIESVHSVATPSIVVDGDEAVVQWVMDVTLKGGVRITMDQLAHQTWRDGRIVKERFFYDSAA